MAAPIVGEQDGDAGDITPNDWPTDSTVFHEYGHLVMYRAWDGFGKWTRNDFEEMPSNFDEREFFGAATKEPWANFIRRVTMNGVSNGASGTPKETLDTLACDLDLEWDNDFDAAEHALCDWFDDNAEQSDSYVVYVPSIWESAGDLMSGENLLPIYNAMRDAWDRVDDDVRETYRDADSFAEGVIRGVHICDFAAAHAASTPTDEYELDQTLKRNGIDCGL